MQCDAGPARRTTQELFGMNSAYSVPELSLNAAPLYHRFPTGKQNKTSVSSPHLNTRGKHPQNKA